MNKHLVPLLILAATAAQAATYDFKYLQERSDGKTEYHVVTLTPGTFLSVDGTGKLQVQTSSAFLTAISGVPTSRSISTGNGITGGGNLSADRTFGLIGQALAFHNLATTGVVVRTAADTVTTRSITASGSGMTVSNGDGVAGNPVVALANDAAAVEALSGTGFAVRTGTDAWTQRLLTAPAAGFTITNSNGVAGNPTFVLADDLGALEALASTGIAVRTGANAWTQRTITAGSAISVSNGDGVAGNPSVAVLDASTSQKGAVQLATNAEVQTGTDSSKGVVSSALAAWWTWVKTQAQAIAGNWSFLGNVIFGDAPTDTFQVSAANPTAANAYTLPPWPGVSGSPGAATLMTRDAVRYDALDTSVISYVEEFGTGGTASGTIGQLGWNLSGTGNIENATGLSNLPGGLHIRTTSMSSALPVYVAYLGNGPSFRGGAFLQVISGAGELRTVAVVGTLNIIDSVAWSYTLGRDGNPPTFDKITPPNTLGVRYIPYAGTAWAGSTAYSVGANVRPVSANGFKYICTTGGTSSGIEPTWPTTLKGTVTDGTVTWTCAGANGDSGSKIQFFVAGSNAETGTTVGTSTISGSTNARLTLRVRTSGTTAYFSVNGETEVPLTIPTAMSMYPAFSVRNDTNAANPDLSIYTWRSIIAGGSY